MKILSIQQGYFFLNSIIYLQLFLIYFFILWLDISFLVYTTQKVIKFFAHSFHLLIFLISLWEFHSFISIIAKFNFLDTFICAEINGI